LLVELSIILVAATKASAVFSNFEKAFNFTTWCLYQVTVKFELNTSTLQKEKFPIAGMATNLKGETRYP
jgi:hypothetical protein